MHRIASGRPITGDDVAKARLIAALTARYAIVVLHLVAQAEGSDAEKAAPMIEAYARVADTTLLIAGTDSSDDAVEAISQRLKTTGTRIVQTTASDGITQRDAA
jgi:electron transfer flavoprotein alpha/beta subunit